ncbi:hypothetical protein ACIBBB_22635, partial [Streptomyces sp. NPDC051217]
MVTFAQAQERADEWVNGDVPAYQHREVRVREFELGFVVWAEDRADGPRSDGGVQRLVIARDSGEATLWPGLPVGEVIRRYEEEYGSQAGAPEPPRAPQRIDLNQTSFLLTPPEWLQDAADKLGTPGASGAGAGAGSGPRSGAAPAGPSVPAPASAPEPSATPAGATPWAGTDTNAANDDGSVGLPATVFAPPLSGMDDDGTPPPGLAAEAPTALMSGGSQLPRTTMAPGLGPASPAPGSPGDIAAAATSKATGPPRGARGGPPAPPGAPGVPGAPGTPGVQPPAPGAPGAPGGGYQPTQFASHLGPGGPGTPPPPPGAPGAPGTPPPGGVHHAATMLADP